MAKEGIPWTVGCFAITILLLILSHNFSWELFRYLGWAFALLTILVAYFYRDPHREPPQGKGLIVSAADGKVAEIERGVEEKTFLCCASVRISLVLSIWDVHINRIPLPGCVEMLEHVPGKLWPAFSSRASRINEHHLVGIRGPEGKILVKQIAGSVARRIICRLHLNQAVDRGQRYGMIQLGSRVDLFLPEEVELRVKRGDRLVGGESIVGVFR